MRCKCDANSQKFHVNNIAIRNKIYYYYRELPRINNHRRYKRISLKTRDFMQAVLKVVKIEAERNHMARITADCGNVLPEETWAEMVRLDVERLNLSKIPVPTSGTQQDLIDLELRRQRIKQIDERIQQLKTGHWFPSRGASNEVVLQNTHANTQTKASEQVYSEQTNTKPIPKYTYEQILASIKKKSSMKTINTKLNNCRIVLGFINIKLKDTFDFDYINSHFADIFDKIKNLGFATSTIKHYKTALKAFLREANILFAGAYPITPLIDNIDTISIKGTPAQSYTPFTEEQLLEIFDPQHDFFKKNPEDFWACMIAMFVASRSNLAHTLRYNDIFIKNGVWCLHFIDDENDKKVAAAGVSKIKRAKNSASERIVPINQQLLDLGFITFVQDRMQRTNADPMEVIFPEILNTKEDDIKHNVNNKFFKFLKKIGIKEESYAEEKAQGVHYSFHSFRKVASQTMEDLGMKPTYINAIAGWQGKDSREQFYGNDREIQKIVTENEKLKYGFLQPHFDKWKEIMAKID